MKITILFLLYKSKTNSRGLCPIRCRITFNKKRKEFSTGLFINPDYWDSKKQKVKPNNESEYINTQLSLIKNKLNQAFLFLQVKGTYFSVEDILLKYKGEKSKDDFGIIEVYNLHLDYIKKLIDKEIKLVTYSKYVESRKHLKAFIKWKFKTSDIQSNKVKSSFLDDFEYYLKTDRNLQQSTLNKVIQRFRKVIKYAIANEYIDKDPFLLFKYKTVKKEVVFLTSNELKLLESYQFQNRRLSRIRDLFVFCCYTGLAYKEMANLKKEDIVEEFDGNIWIHIYRNKTNRVYKVPLLPKAKSIIELYNGEDAVYVFKGISNQRFNMLLKEIAALVGISKRLSHHLARKTFASTVLLYNDVPMEIVSELLGHSSIKITQNSYGKVVQKKVSEEIIKLNSKLNR